MNTLLVILLAAGAGVAIGMRDPRPRPAPPTLPSHVRRIERPALYDYETDDA